MAGVYISYPFCNQKCTFCNFASGVSATDAIESYHTALAAELESHCWAWQPETLYFGGGTPSLMPPDFLRRIMGLIPRSNLREVTLECAPGTVTAEKIHTWLACGINRISLGVQSFIKKELRQTGRRHDCEIVTSEIAAMRNAGLTNINIDLIAGLPHQTLESMDESLDLASQLDPPHISLYAFEVDEGSRLGNEIILGGKRYGAPNVPDEDLTAVIYGRAAARLRSLGYHHYEISNFAKPGFESRHNMKYWLLEPYVGFGLDAHSFDGHARWSSGACERTPTDRGEERFFVGLRLLDGIEPTVEEWSRFARPIEKWLKAGMLEHSGARLRLTPQAVLISNEIFQEFVG